MTEKEMKLLELIKEIALNQKGIVLSIHTIQSQIEIMNKKIKGFE